MSRLYRPSNGTEGMGFFENWCNTCARDKAFRDDPDSGDGCPILAATMIYDIDEPEYPREWTYAADGSPKCTAFTTEDPPPVRCTQTPDMFQ